MTHAISSNIHGTFVGTALGLAFFSREDTAGQYVVATFPTDTDAKEFIAELQEEVEYLGDLSVVKVKSGHWQNLQEAGLHVADMARNEIYANKPAGSC